jgi:hypothetical protein
MARATTIPTSDFSRQTEVLEAELAGWIDQRGALDARISARRELLEAMRRDAELAENGTSSNGTREHVVPASFNEVFRGSAPPPKTGEAVLRVLRDAGRPVSATEVYGALNQRGWLPQTAKPMNTIRSTLWYLAKIDRVERRGSQADRTWTIKAAPRSENPPPGGEP